MFKATEKLGSWSEYLEIRQVIIESNKQHNGELSSDLGAFAGLLYEIGMHNLLLGANEYISEKESDKIISMVKKRHHEATEEKEEESLHTEMQYHLLKIGAVLGYDVIPASNDRSKCFAGNNFSFPFEGKSFAPKNPTPVHIMTYCSNRQMQCWLPFV
jgi:type II restriction enzyme